jgi:hypothetical protein
LSYPRVPFEAGEVFLRVVLDLNLLRLHALYGEQQEQKTAVGTVATITHDIASVFLTSIGSVSKWLKQWSCV